MGEVTNVPVSDGAKLLVASKESETMALSAVQILDPREQAIPSTVSLQLRWYAAYTCANHEKRVRDQMEQRSVESFLPVYQTVRRWKDRWIELPMHILPG